MQRLASTNSMRSASMFDPAKAIAVVQHVDDPRSNDWNADEEYDFKPRLNKTNQLSDIEREEMIAGRDRRKQERERIYKKQIPISFVIASTRLVSESKKLSKELMVYIPFLIMFVFFFLAGRSIEAQYWVGAGPGMELSTGQLGPVDANYGPYWGKMFTQLVVPEDWYEWVEGVAQPLLWDNADQDATFNVNNFCLGSNMKLGSLRLRIIRVRSDSCNVNTEWYPKDPKAYSRECYGPYNSKNVDKSDFGPATDPKRFKYYTCSSTFGRRILGKMGNYDCGGNIYDIPFNISGNDALAAMDLLRGADPNDPTVTPVPFIDLKSARLIVLEMFTYNPGLDIFTSFKNWIEVTKGGAFITNGNSVSFEYWTKRNTGMTIYGFFFLLFVLYYWVMFIRSIIQARAQKGGALRFLFQLWNSLEFCNLVIFLAVFAFRWAWWSRCWKLKFILPGVGYSDDLDYILWLFQITVYLNAVNTVIVFLKVLKFVGLNPRLNILTRTLAAAYQNLVGILIIFVVVLVAYMITATTLFGTGMEDFRDLENSISSLLRLLIGDFDYDSMKAENRFIAGVFFWSYVILGLFLLLNFIIAVIGDAFQEENEKTKADPLFEQFLFFIQKLIMSIQNIIKDPRGYITKIISDSRSEFSQSGKITLLVDTLQAYRESLPTEEEFTEAEKQDMTDEELEAALANPEICRHDLVAIFESVYGAEAAERFNYIGGDYLNTIWLDVHKEFSVNTVEEENEEEAKRMILIHESAATSLKHVLGLEIQHGKKVSHDVMSVQQLFAPTTETIEILGKLDERVAAMEEQAASITHILCKLDSKLTSVMHQLANTSVSRTSAADIPAMPRTTASLPPL